MTVATTALGARRPLVLADLLPATLLRDAALVAGGAAFTGLAAQISVPVHGSPVPVTGQTLAVVLVGASLGWWRSLLSMALYLIAGSAGMPWFASHKHGLGGPTFGYIVGFVFAAALVGYLAGRGGDRTPVRTVATMIAGNAVIYLFGLPWLAHDLGVSMSKAYDFGMRDYLFGDGLKIIIAAGLLPAAWYVVRRVLGSNEH